MEINWQKQNIAKERAFYNEIERKREEINNLDISDKQRGELLKVIDETIQRYEDEKRNYLNNLIKTEELNKTVRKLERVIQDLSLTATTVRFDVEERLKEVVRNLRG
ncbi:MAG: hypothetical protein WC533_01120 [Candidatus Pacearchaeota archaeon]